MLRRIYIKHIKCSNDSSRLWWNWQFCEKRSENWSRPIPSIGLGRQTTTSVLFCTRVAWVCLVCLLLCREEGSSPVFAITERRDMGLYEVPLSVSLLGFGIGTMLANFHV